MERARVAEFVVFFRDFADACHHGKEEDILFKKLVEIGFPREHGPVGVISTSIRKGASTSPRSLRSAGDPAP